MRAKKILGIVVAPVPDNRLYAKVKPWNFTKETTKHLNKQTKEEKKP